MIDIETVSFIELLNRLAKLTEICKVPVPFSEKSPEILEKCKKDPSYKDTVIFFDDEQLEAPPGPCMGVFQFPIVQEYLVDDEHDDIVSCYDGVLLTFDGNEWYIEVCVEDKKHKLHEFIVENGTWYSTKNN